MAEGKLWCGKQPFQPTTSDDMELYTNQEAAIAAVNAATAGNFNKKGYNDAKKRRALEKRFALAVEATYTVVDAIAQRQIAAKQNHEALIATTSPLMRRDSGLELDLPAPPKTVTVEIIYKLRDVTGIQPFEIDAVPRDQRCRAASEVSASDLRPLLRKLELIRISSSPRLVTAGRAMEWP